MRTFCVLSAGMLFVLIAGAVPARAATYSGALFYDPAGGADETDGLYVTGSKWSAYALSIAWTVTNEDGDSPAGFPWKYTYTVRHDGDGAAFSHMIIEASATFTSANLVGLTGAKIDSVGDQDEGPGNPGIPEGLHGIKFDPSGEFTHWVVTFYSNRAPVWGDVYAKDGVDNKKDGGATNAFWNYNLTDGVERGFLSPDVDPSASPANGSLDYHLLVPDTTNTTVPEPATMAFLAIGGAGLIGGAVRRRRRR